MFREGLGIQWKDETPREEPDVPEPHSDIERLPERKELADLDEPTQKQVTDRAIELFRDVLGPRKDYAVMASTAMYLHGKELKLRGDPRADDLDVPPGDFDVVVTSKEALGDIRDHLSRVPGVIFDRAGQYGHFPGQPTSILSGKIDITADTSQGEIVVPYDFEFFYQTRIVEKSALRDMTNIQGVNVLGFEGLLEQYKNNRELEGRVERSVEDIAAYLMRPEVASQVRDDIKEGQASQGTMKLLERFNISLKQAGEFYAHQEEIDLLSKSAEQFPDHKDLNKRLQSEIYERAKIFAKLGTKVAKRELNIEQLAALLGRT